MNNMYVNRMLKKWSVTVLSAALLCGTLAGCQNEPNEQKETEADISEVKELSMSMLDEKELEKIRDSKSP